MPLVAVLSSYIYFFCYLLPGRSEGKTWDKHYILRPQLGQTVKCNTRDNTVDI